jgi:Methyl-accepting chemotaxis protein (MCP) signaling domain.
MDQAVATACAGSEGVTSGVAIVNSTGEIFKKITKSVVVLSQQIKGISESIDQIMASSQTLVSSIHEIDAVSKKNASEVQTVSAATEEQSASMEEFASSSEGLARLASNLQGALGKFRV